MGQDCPYLPHAFDRLGITQPIPLPLNIFQIPCILDASTKHIFLKRNNTILHFLLGTSFLAFSSDSLSVIKKNLRDSICTFQVINPQHTAVGPSTLYKLTDSLNQMSTLEEKLQNFHSSNYILKYYSYIAILHESDSLGLILLKES